MLRDFASYDHGAPQIDEQELETPSELKQIVHYSKVSYIQVGRPCILYPIDHPSQLVSNKKPVATSYVQGANAISGEIETQNTRYLPSKEAKTPYFTLD
jgi:hypothetical protein